MTRPRPQGRRTGIGSAQAARAVIDIGSNTVRLVVFGGPARAPSVLLNEKVAARLGRDLPDTGTLPEKAIEVALLTLARFALLLEDLGVTDCQTVATAAVRDAENGAEFLTQVAGLGLVPRLLSGEEEARASASGVLGAFPDAQGVVADLGGGSLELIAVANGDSHHGVSLPLGTLRLPGLRAKGSDKFKRAVNGALEKAGWAAAHPGPLYMVGGTWRALATYAMREADYPLTDPHGFEISRDDAAAVAKSLSRSDTDKLAAISGISAMRAAALPDAAAMLRIMLDELASERLVFSSWGLREGLLFRRLDPAEQAKDPLLVGIGDFAAARQASMTDAARLAAWSAPVASGDGNGSERLRFAAGLLALALRRIEPNLRRRDALEWSLDKRWIALDARGRAMLAAALLASCGTTEWPDSLSRLAGENDLREAAAWGLATRLAHRFGAATPISLMTSALMMTDKALTLTLDPTRAALASENTAKDLRTLAEWLGRKGEMRIARVLAT